MYRSAILCCVFIVAAQSVVYDRRIAEYGRRYNFNINGTIEYIFDYKNTSVYPARVIVSSTSATKLRPLLVVVQQEKRITSWQIPFMINSEINQMYQIAGHILCPNINLLKNMSTSMMLHRASSDIYTQPTVTIKSSTTRNISFSIYANIQYDFFMKANEEYHETLSISEPMYYYYNFHDKGNEAEETGAVLLTVESPSALCMIVSVQNTTCPVYDLENNIKFNSYWQTMNYKSAMVLLKKNYPHGFYVVMSVKQYDGDCTNTPMEMITKNRTKTVTFSVKPTISLSQHVRITLATVAIFGGVFIVCTIIAVIYLVVKIKKASDRAEETQLDETDGIGESQINLRNQLFVVSQKSKVSTNYIWHVGIVALFYSLPVLQLVLTYQGILHDTGNEDLCYYNFLCAHPLGFITDFNHVFSNIGYVLLGVLFWIITYIKELQERSRCNPGFGLPKPFGMYKALAFALVMEGVLSACYHICPKMSNFQFDTSFMYVMTVLMTVNMYESRFDNGDIRGYVVFGMLAAATTLSVFGSYFSNELSFWIVYTIIHIVLCLYLTWHIDGTMCKKVFKCKWKLSRVEIYRLIFWIIGNCINIALATFGVIMRESFATHLLMVLIVNCLFYLVFYILMKLVYKERILVLTWILIVLDSLIWAGALYFFITKVTSWEVTPAESRSYNQDCKIAGYYDNHDIWHFMSSVALFFSFNILLTLDEGLSKVRNSDIPDFHGH